MKQTINGKRYDSNRCELLASRDHRSYSNNYSGTTALLLAKDGVFLLWTDANGQDCYLQDSMVEADDPKGWLDGVDLTDEQESRLVELGMIEIV